MGKEPFKGTGENAGRKRDEAATGSRSGQGYEAGALPTHSLHLSSVLRVAPLNLLSISPLHPKPQTPAILGSSSPLPGGSNPEDNLHLMDSLHLSLLMGVPPSTLASVKILPSLSR